MSDNKIDDILGLSSDDNDFKDETVIEDPSNIPVDVLEPKSNETTDESITPDEPKPRRGRPPKVAEPKPNNEVQPESQSGVKVEPTTDVEPPEDVVEPPEDLVPNDTTAESPIIQQDVKYTPHNFVTLYSRPAVKFVTGRVRGQIILHNRPSVNGFICCTAVLSGRHIVKGYINPAELPERVVSRLTAVSST